MKQDDATLCGDEHDHEKQSKTLLGFWLYLMTDCIVFASLFAVQAVFSKSSFGGLVGPQLFHLPSVALRGSILLASSYTCGLFMLALQEGAKSKAQGLLWATFATSLVFCLLQVREFSHLVASGNSWHKSAYLSSYFNIMATHLLHIVFGLLWIVVLQYLIFKKGLIASVLRKSMCLQLFWAFINIIWILLFTFVYLVG